MNTTSSNSDTVYERQQIAAGTPNSSSKFAQILLDLKREEKIDPNNTICLNSHSSGVNSTIDKHCNNNVTYNFAVEAEKLNYSSVSGNNFLSSFASSKRFSAADDEEQMAESDNEHAYQDSSVMFTALNRLESTEMCNCKKSRCLKLYCQCFAAKFTCTSSCRCVACENVSKNSKVRKAAVQTMLERNPAAFDSKYKPSLANQSDVVPVTAHKIGCKCRRSKCLKKYCECFEGAVPCSNICSCVECSNPANQLGSGPEPSFAKVKTEVLSQWEETQTQTTSKSHNNKKLTFGTLPCSQETEASTDDEFEHPGQVDNAAVRSSTGKALNRSLSWSATASSSASHQLKRKRSVDSSSVFKKEYKERHSKKGLSSQGPAPVNAATPSQHSNQKIHINVPAQGVVESTPTGLNIVSALALLTSSISEQKGLGWGNLTSLGLGSSNALNSLGIGSMSSTIASATPTSLSIASMLALLSQSIQAEQHQAAGTLDSPPAVAASSEAEFLSPNTLSIASALALLSSSIQAEQKSRQASGSTSSSSPAVGTSSMIPEPLGERPTTASSYHSSGSGGGIAFLSPVVEQATRADCSSSSDRPSPSETTTDPENDSPSITGNSFCDAGRAPLTEGDDGGGGGCPKGRAEETPPSSDSISTLPMMSPVF